MVFPKAAVSRHDLDARFAPELLWLARAIGRGAKPLVGAEASARRAGPGQPGDAAGQALARDQATPSASTATVASP